MNQFISCFKEWFQGESHSFYKMNRKNTLQSGPFNIRVWYSSTFKSMFILAFDSFYFWILSEISAKLFEYQMALLL